MAVTRASGPSLGRPRQPASVAAIGQRLRELGPGSSAVVGLDRQDGPGTGSTRWTMKGRSWRPTARPLDLFREGLGITCTSRAAARQTRFSGRRSRLTRTISCFDSSADGSGPGSSQIAPLTSPGVESETQLAHALLFHHSHLYNHLLVTLLTPLGN